MDLWLFMRTILLPTLRVLSYRDKMLRWAALVGSNGEIMRTMVASDKAGRGMDG